MYKNSVLEVNGLSIGILKQLSFKSKLGISLKKNLHYFDKENLLDELYQMTEWFDEQDILSKAALDYRIKSTDSIIQKYERYYPDHQTRKVFDDVLGFRAFCDAYEDIFQMDLSMFRVADLSKGKAEDDGYRGVHLYFQIDNMHYPIEIQYNTLYDRQMNNWLHKYLYKKAYGNEIGMRMRQKYESGCIRNTEEFEEVLSHVLSDC